MKISRLSVVVLIAFLTSSHSGVPLSRYEQIKYKDAAESQDMGLYDANDKVISLTSQNLKSRIYNQNYATLLEFYNSFCGHCRRFAPKYKQLAENLWPWRDVLKVMAIDCATDANNDICREYEIMGYPTVRYYGPKQRESKENLGLRITTQDIDQIKDTLIGHLMNDSSTVNVANDAEITNILQKQPEVELVLLIYEPENLTVVEELKLDFNRFHQVEIRRALPEFAHQIQMGNQLPMVAIDANRNHINFSNISTTYDGFKSEISKFIKDKGFHQKGEPLDKIDNLDTHNKAIDDQGKMILDVVKRNIPAIYQADLENALRFSIFTEITKFTELTGERLLALQKYIGVVRRYNPLGERGQQLLDKIEEYVLVHNQSISGEAIETKLKELKEMYSPIFSSDHWVGCLPSKPGLRGYTCGLWQLFHYMTVQAAEADKSANPLEVLQAMHGYVKYFFGCSECATHFLDMAARRKIWSTPSKDEAVLWLWSAHNEVNNRLAGDETEDPMFPKIQFPPKEVCRNCYRETPHTAITINEINWDKIEVLTFLKRIYNSQNISRYGLENDGAPPSKESLQDRRILANVFSEMDMRMGILLYVFCIGMMVIAVKLFLYKGYRKKIYTHDFLGKV